MESISDKFQSILEVERQLDEQYKKAVQRTIKARKVMTEVPLVQEQQANGVEDNSSITIHPTFLSREGGVGITKESRGLYEINA